MLSQMCRSSQTLHLTVFATHHKTHWIHFKTDTNTHHTHTHTTTHTTLKRLTDHAFFFFFSTKHCSSDSLSHERNITPLLSAGTGPLHPKCYVLPQETFGQFLVHHARAENFSVQRAVWTNPRPTHSAPCCGALPLRCGVVVVVVVVVLNLALSNSSL